ncbi:MAG TPA: flagellar motor protein MotB [Candidatus Acidoferrum sp.]|nr:flagellar motor protein MotB [Candidatus Acidoferrum sp.]
MSDEGHDSSGSMRWLLTYADMITLLLAFFVIMYAISKVDAKRYQAIAHSIRGAFGTSTPYPVGTGGGGGDQLLPKPDLVFQIIERLQASLGEEMRDGKIQIERTPEGITLRFQDTIFFERGKAELHAHARGILDRLAVVIRELPNTIEAEGHTDTLPIRSSQFPSNWELSVARATAVVRYLVESQGLSPLRLAARGLGEHKPIYPNDPVLGEPRNRRVEIRIVSRG